MNNTSITDLLHKVTKYQTKLAHGSNNADLYKAKVAYYMSHLSKAGVNINQLGGTTLSDNMMQRAQEILKHIEDTKNGDYKIDAKLSENAKGQLGSLTEKVHEVVDVVEKANSQHKTTIGELSDVVIQAQKSLSDINKKFPLDIKPSGKDADFDPETQNKLAAAKHILDNVDDFKYIISASIAEAMMRDLASNGLSKEKLSDIKEDFDRNNSDDKQSMEYVFNEISKIYNDIRPHVQYLLNNDESQKDTLATNALIKPLDKNKVIDAINKYTRQYKVERLDKTSLNQKINKSIADIYDMGSPLPPVQPESAPEQA
jgi:hypothetical protein